jgi:hypothetical protein
MSSTSPCIGICVLEDDVCIGCGRTIAQIFQAGVDAGCAPSAPATAEDKEED